MRKHLTFSNILFVALLIAMLIPQSRVFIQSNLLRLFLSAPDKVEEVRTVERPIVRLVSLEGEEVQFPLGGSKPKLINVWATWCGPCVAEMPSIQKLYTDYADRVDFALIANEDTSILNAFLQRKEFDMPVYLQAEALPASLQSSTIPATYILSADGEILVAESGAKDWNSEEVRALLDSEIKKAQL